MQKPEAGSRKPELGSRKVEAGIASSKPENEDIDESLPPPRLLTPGFWLLTSGF
jgi:hypothetical protein